MKSSKLKKTLCLAALTYALPLQAQPCPGENGGPNPCNGNGKPFIQLGVPGVQTPAANCEVVAVPDEPKPLTHCELQKPVINLGTPGVAHEELIKDTTVDCPDIFCDDKPVNINPTLIQNLHVIILNGDVSVTSSNDLPHKDGVHLNKLEACGDLEGMRKRIEDRFINCPFSKKDLEELKEIIVSSYVAWGYPLVDVCVPPQDVTDGSLHVSILESKLGEIRIGGNYRFANSCFTQYLRAEEGYPIDYNHISSDLYWINRNPFRRASIVFAPGKNPGTTDLEMIVDERFPLRVYGGVDNRGTIPVGRNRGFVGFNWGNAFGFDHTLSYQFTASERFNRLQGHAVGYEAPLPWKHVLYLYGGYAQVKVNHINGEFDNKGRNYQFSGWYEVPLCDYAPCMCHGFDIGFDYKKTNNNLFFSDNPVFSHEVQLTQASFGYWLDADRPWGEVSFEAQLVASPFRWLKHQNKVDYNSLRPYSKVRYIYIKGESEIDYFLPADWVFTTRVQAQWTNENLLPSEEFWIGGFDTVRGYYERILDGDSGVILNLELYTPPLSPVKWLDLECFRNVNFCEILEFLVFFDYGTTSPSIRVTDQEKEYQYLMSIGPGLRYYIDDHLEIRADWGFQLHRYEKHKSLGNLVNFSVLVAF